MEIQRVKLSELKHDKKNARRHDERNVEEIKRSLQEFGQHRPFVVQRGTNRVIVGNGMLDAMLALGMTEGDAYIVDDDEETSIRRALADNRTGELASWDMSVLKDLFQDMGPDVNVPGWNASEIEELFSLPLSPDGLSTDFSLPDGERSTMRQMSFVLADEQQKLIATAIDAIKSKNVCGETFGNTNSNGNALYWVVKEWVELKR